jgi:alpha-galactosidase
MFARAANNSFGTSRRDELMIPRKNGIAVICITLGFTLMLTACSKLPTAPQKAETAKPAPTQPSAINVDVKGGGPVTLTTSAAEFQVTPDGYVQAFLLKDGKKLSLDEPKVGAPADGDFVQVAGNDVHFTLDFQQAHVQEAIGKMGAGKRIEIPAHPLGPSGTDLQLVLALEVYDKFPNILLSTVEYKNTGASDVVIDKSVNQRRRLNARLADAKIKLWEMWSFHGSSYDWGKDDVVKLTPAFSQPNVMGGIVKGGYGGGIPVVAFWTREVGEAVGHVETIPLPAAIPAKVAADGRVDTEVDFAANITLKPGETYSTPRSFVSVYAGDFYEPLRIWSSVLQKEGWDLPKPSSEAYNVSWCGWGYQADVTPAQMLGTIPKLKELGI